MGWRDWGLDVSMAFFSQTGEILDICSDQKSSIVRGKARVDLWARSFGGVSFRLCSIARIAIYIVCEYYEYILVMLRSDINVVCSNT